MKRVNFKLPDEVYNTMLFKSKALGVNNTSLFKSLIMEQPIIHQSNYKDYTKVLGLLGNLTNNINQIAKVLNIANKEGILEDVDYDNFLNVLTVILDNSERSINDK